MQIAVKADVGVIVGRFQVPDLHQAHRALIQSVCDAHDKVLLVLGLSPLPVTRQNPLDLQARRQLIGEHFPYVQILYIKDMPSDEAWSDKLDGIIEENLTPAQTAVLYGSRDSFISRYHGRYPTEELTQDTFESGTEIRKAIARASTRNSVEFRRGVVWAAHSRFPTSYTTVDVAVLNENADQALLARKPHEDGLRFIGGFADPDSPTFEADARREVQEEAHIAITDPEYLASFPIDDWRYRGEADAIKTLFFRAKYLSGRPTPDDDIAELRWVDLQTVRPTHLVPCHRPLMAHLLKTLRHGGVSNPATPEGE